MNEQNPLARKMRVPKIYVELPSDGKFYDPGVLELSADNTLPVLPMTAMDEMTLKTPDALLNGEGIVNTVQSCCPNVYDARSLLTNDVDVILMAIRSATYGDQMKFSENCPKCNNENEFETQISYVLETIEKMDNDHYVQLDKDFYVHLRPYDLNTNTKVALESFEQQKILNQVSSEEDVDDVEKLEKFGTSFRRAALLRTEILLNTIRKVVLVENNEKQEITDANHIKDWLMQTDLKTVNTIQDKVNELNNIGIRDDFELQCQNEECQHKWQTKIYFDPSDFFGIGS